MTSFFIRRLHLSGDSERYRTTQVDVLEADGFQAPGGHPRGSADVRDLLQRRKNMIAQMSTKTMVATGKFSGVSPVMTEAIKPQMIATTAIRATAMMAS
jgi:hypothetical protein